jgi:hypothetical protein
MVERKRRVGEGRNCVNCESVTSVQEGIRCVTDILEKKTCSNDCRRQGERCQPGTLKTSADSSSALGLPKLGASSSRVVGHATKVAGFVFTGA